MKFNDELKEQYKSNTYISDILPTSSLQKLKAISDLFSAIITDDISFSGYPTKPRMVATDRRVLQTLVLTKDGITQDHLDSYFEEFGFYIKITWINEKFPIMEYFDDKF